MIVLILTSNWVARIDRRRGKSAECRVAKIAIDGAAPDLADLARQALSLGKRRRDRVWVVASLLWADTVRLVPSADRTLDVAERRSALAFELEGISGLDPIASEIGYRPLEGSSYLTTQLSADLVPALRDSVHTQGGRLMGLCHPAVLATRQSAKTEGDGRYWCRRERWPDGEWLLTWREYALVDVQFSDPEDATREIDSVLDLSATPIFEADYLGPFQEGIAIQTWCDLLANAGDAPWLLRPSAAPLPSRSRALIASGILGLTLFACAGHHLIVLRPETSRMEASLAVARNARRESDERRVEAVRIERELAALRGTTAAIQEQLTQRTRLIAGQQDRLATLIAAIAATVPIDAAVSKVEILGDAATLEGLSTGPTVASDFALELQAKVEGKWRVSASTHEQVDSPSGLPVWVFHMPLQGDRPRESKYSKDTTNATPRPTSVGRRAP